MVIYRLPPYTNVFPTSSHDEVILSHLFSTYFIDIYIFYIYILYDRYRPFVPEYKRTESVKSCKAEPKLVGKTCKCWLKLVGKSCKIRGKLVGKSCKLAFIKDGEWIYEPI